MTTALIATKQWIETRAGSRQQWLVWAVLSTLLAAILIGTTEIARSSWGWLTGGTVVAAALLATFGTATATAVGGLPVFAAKSISQKTTSAMLGFGAGVMLAATAFSLIVPGIEAAEQAGQNPLWAATTVAVALLLGGAAMIAADRALPHQHFIATSAAQSARELKRIWLFVGAIALHNFPEGLAVGVGFGSGELSNGVALATGIGIQNLPEGLVVALALAAVGYSAAFAASVAALTGLLEPLGGLLGAGVVSMSEALLPWGLGIAAGAMLFVVSHEIIPESHRKGHERLATLGLMAGFAVMMTLDTALG